MEELEALIVPVLGQAEIASSAVEDDLQDDSQPSTAADGGKKVRSRESDTPGSLSQASRGDERKTMPISFAKVVPASQGRIWIISIAQRFSRSPKGACAGVGTAIQCSALAMRQG